jgi:hypothetical protein
MGTAQTAGSQSTKPSLKSSGETPRLIIQGLVQNSGCQCVPGIFAPVLGPGVGRGVDFEVGGSRGRGSLRGHHGDQQA